MMTMRIIPQGTKIGLTVTATSDTTESATESNTLKISNVNVCSYAGLTLTFRYQALRTDASTQSAFFNAWLVLPFSFLGFEVNRNDINQTLPLAQR